MPERFEKLPPDAFYESVDNESEKRIHPFRLSSASLKGAGADYDRYPPRGYPTSYYQSEMRDSSSSHLNLLGGDSPDFETGTDPFSNSLLNHAYWSSAFPLYLHQNEADDYMHNPDPGMDAREDNVFKLDRRTVSSLCSLGVLVVGLILLFVVIPALTYTGNTPESANYNPGISDKGSLPFYPYANLRAGRPSLVDPDTPTVARTRKSTDGKMYNLVFSDEFNQPNRTFYPNDDQFWEAVNIWYGATQDLEWYDPDAITTKDGFLEITFDSFKNNNLHFRSGMLQSWNKLCFKGGILEASISLPGRGDIKGLWPGFWTLGNLARPGYLATSEGLWPYSYQNCDAGITPNQSSPDGISFLPGMKLPSCTCKNEDHPTPGTGRGAPEIDVLEGSVSDLTPDHLTKVGTLVQSLQVAPFDIWYMPNYDYMAIFNQNVTTWSPWKGGPLQQAVSTVTTLNKGWYDGQEYQTYGLEYDPGSNGFVEWNVGREKLFRVNGGALGPNGNIGSRPISQEPMSIVFNVGMSRNWVWIDFENLRSTMPAKMRIDYIRIYQDPSATSLSCDPKGFETTSYIKEHLKAYLNSNLTNWKDTGYRWPANSLMSGC